MIVRYFFQTILHQSCPYWKSELIGILAANGIESIIFSLSVHYRLFYHCVSVCLKIIIETIMYGSL